MTATKKTRIVRPTSSTLRLDDGEVVHVGVDAHKATYHVAVLSDRRGFLATWVQPADPELLVAKLEPFRDAGRPGRLRGRPHRLHPDPPAPGRGPPGRGDRPVEDADAARAGGQVRPARLPQAGHLRPEGPARAGPRPHRAARRPTGRSCGSASSWSASSARSSSRSRRSSCSTASPSRRA